MKNCLSLCLLAYSFFILFTNSHAAEIIDLAIPDLSDAKIIRYSAGVRPCRKSGIRLEAETIGDKLVIHDYGHGGSGISLSWGCAHEAVNIMKQHMNQQVPIAIIGAGIIGLATAHILRDQGYSVTVYSRDFIPNTTSNKAAGIWSPHFGLGAMNEDQFARCKDISYALFSHLATCENPEFCGVFLLPSYSEKSQFKVTDQLPESYVVVQVNGVSRVCKKKQILVFDLNIYLNDLFEKAKSKGIVFVQKNIESTDELMQLPETVILNCTGLGSRELFNDHELYPVKGHLVVYEAQPEIDFIVCNHHQKENIFFSLIPWKSQLLLGGSLEEGIEDHWIDEEKIACLRQNAKEFFNL
jgi:D-amino-acid oxidase